MIKLIDILKENENSKLYHFTHQRDIIYILKENILKANYPNPIRHGMNPYKMREIYEKYKKQIDIFQKEIKEKGYSDYYNKLKPNSPIKKILDVLGNHTPGVSLTRDPNLNLISRPSFRLTLDRNKLSKDYNIIPWEDIESFGDQSEEVIYNDITPLNKYLTEVAIIKSRDHFSRLKPFMDELISLYPDIKYI